MNSIKALLAALWAYMLEFVDEAANTFRAGCQLVAAAYRGELDEAFLVSIKDTSVGTALYKSKLWKSCSANIGTVATGLGVAILIVFILANVVISFMSANAASTYNSLNALANGTTVPAMSTGDRALMQTSTLLFVAMMLFALLSFFLIFTRMISGGGKGRGRGSYRGR